MEFKQFAKAINDQFNTMATTGKLYRVNTDNEEIKQVYLDSFPEGTNPLYITNTTHDCSCCKSFIRNVGNLVTIQDGKIITIWDVTVDSFYQQVADTMREYILSKPIHSIFYASERKYGAYETKQKLEDGKSITWNHFHCAMPSTLFKGDKVGELTGRDTTSATMLRDTLNMFTINAIDTVIELIESNSLYRGEEHLQAVKGFRELYLKYNHDFYSNDSIIYSFEHFNHPQARFKNTVIGTLVEDLSKAEKDFLQRQDINKK